MRKAQLTGGILTLSDLASYHVNVTRALVGSYRGRKVYTTHAPTSGPGELLKLSSSSLFDEKKFSCIFST